MAVYAGVPLLILWFDFQAIFVIGGTAALVAALIWMMTYERSRG